MNELLCECGCGDRIEVKPHHKYKGVPRFKRGHHTRTEQWREVRVKTRSRLPAPNPSGLCMCGCGKTTPLAKCSGRGKVCGEHMRYIHGHHNRGLTGAAAANWKGGRVRNRSYMKAYAPDHPDSDSKGYIYEHRLVMEGHLGRRLLPQETVHHINGDGHDNRIENLELRVGRHGKGATGKHCSTCQCFEH